MIYTDFKNNSANPNSLWWIGVILWMVPFLICSLLMVKSQLEFIQLYRKRNGINTKFTHELIDRYTNQPLLWFSESLPLSWKLFRLIWQRYSEPKLDNVARKVRRYFWLTVAVMFGLFPLPVIFSFLAIK